MPEKSFSTKEAVSFGWGSMKKNFLFFLVFLIVTAVIQGIFTDERGLASVSSIFPLIGLLVSILINIASVKVSLDAASQKPLTLEGIKEALPQFLNFLILGVLYFLIIAAGFILLVIPGIIWAIQFSMAPYLVIDKKMAPKEALVESSRITRGKRWQLFLFNLVLLLIIIAGALVFGIGLFAALPTVMVADAFVYNKLK